jgi:hypothetical protein
MKLIDNINQLLGDSLKARLKPDAKLQIAASCFSICAYDAFADFFASSGLQFKPAPVFTRDTLEARSKLLYSITRNIWGV